MVVCVSVVMVFIVGIWLLSAQESVTKSVSDLPDVIEQGKQNIGENVPSLTDLFKQSAPLRIEDKEVQGSQFFDQQFQNKDDKMGDKTTPSGS